jgi:hypothetical protein
MQQPGGSKHVLADLHVRVALLHLKLQQQLIPLIALLVAVQSFAALEGPSPCSKMPTKDQLFVAAHKHTGQAQNCLNWGY